MQSIDDVLQDFVQILDRSKRIKRLDSHSAILLPPGKSKRNPLPADAEFAACIFGLTHGDEIIGAYVLRDILHFFANGLIQIKMPFVIMLNNVEAALKNVRFIQQDFNRIYGQIERDGSYESLRNQKAKNLLDESLFCLDIHQTALPLPIAAHFWPTLEDPKTIKAIKCVDPYGIIVSTPGKDRSALGLGVSCDNYMLLQGKSSLTVELGAKGFSVSQLGLGIKTTLSFIDFVQRYVMKEVNETKESEKHDGTEYITVGVIESKEGSYLRQDLQSFSPLKKGEILGQDGSGRAILSPQDCFALFPKVKGKVKATSKDPLTYLIKRKQI